MSQNAVENLRAFQNIWRIILDYSTRIIQPGYSTQKIQPPIYQLIESMSELELNCY